MTAEGNADLERAEELEPGIARHYRELQHLDAESDAAPQSPSERPRTSALSERQLLGARHHGFEHLRREPPRLRVVARAMIAGDEHTAARQLRFDRVTKLGEVGFNPCARSTLSCAIEPSASIARAFGKASMRDERNGRHVAISAGVGLFSGGAQRTALVIIAPFKREAIFGVGAVLPFREAKLLQRAVEQVARVIAGERAAGAVGAHAARREADDEQARIGIAERGRSAIEPGRLGALVASR
jgi:hypothetical protein